MLRATVTALLFATLLLPARAQTPADLETLSRDAALIFSGRVEAIEHISPAAPGDLGTVRIMFRVTRGFRGAADSQAIAIVEWEGLWTSGERYRVGEQLLLFFYAPSGELGLTSSVAGERGRIELSDAQPLLAELERLRATDKPPLPPAEKPQKKPLRPSLRSNRPRVVMNQ
ncbi:MAG: hypothetical protein ACR2IF_18490 [Terriglobales bacterium]